MDQAIRGFPRYTWTFDPFSLDSLWGVNWDVNRCTFESASHSRVSMLRVKRHRLASWVPWSRILRLGFQNNPWRERPVDCVWSCWHCCLCGLSLRLLRLKGTQQCDKVLIVVSLEDDLHFSFVAPPVKTLVAPGGVVWVNWVSAVMTAPCPELASLGLLPHFAWRSLRAPVNGFVPLLYLSYPACTVLQTPVGWPNFRSFAFRFWDVFGYFAQAACLVSGLILRTRVGLCTVFSGIFRLQFLNKHIAVACRCPLSWSLWPMQLSWLLPCPILPLKSFKHCGKKTEKKETCRCTLHKTLRSGLEDHGKQT